MSKTLAQIFVLNPSTVIAATDLLYLVHSPYTPGTDSAILGSDLITQFGTGTVNPGLINEVAYYATTGNAVSGLAVGITDQVLTATTGLAPSWKFVPTITRFIVNPTAGLGNYTTIQAAINAASAGDNIYVTPATYTENLTLKAGVNITTLRGNGNDGLVTILGNATFTGTGSVEITNLQLKTNGAPLLTVSGSNASVVNLIGCTLNCINNTGISYTSSNSSSAINIVRCTGDIGAAATAIYIMTSTGLLTSRYSIFTNSGGSVLQSTNSAGSVTLNYCILNSPHSSSGTGNFLMNYTFIDTSAQNTTALEMAGSGSSIIRYTDVKSGSATAISIDIGSTVNIISGVINTSNPAAISGGGVLSYALTSFVNSSAITVSTQNPVALTTFQGGTGLTSYILGDTLYASAANVLSKLAGNITSVKQYLSQTGTGAVSAAPAWATISGSDITGAALTKTDDTNVTLTLGGSPTTALLRATSLTLGWAGVLSLTRGGTNASLTASNGGIVWSNATQLQILSGTSTSRQMLQSGATATPAWSTATWPATTTANQILFSSATNTVSEITGVVSSLVTTNSSGVPSLQSMAWSSYSPTVTLVGGSGNTVPVYTTNTGRFCRMGNTVFFEVTLQGDGGAEGAGTGSINIALPVNAASSGSVSVIRGDFTNGALLGILQGSIVTSGSTIAFAYWNTISTVTSFVGNNQNDTSRNINIQGWYQVAAL